MKYLWKAGSLSFVKNGRKNLARIWIKCWVVNTTKSFLIIPNNALQVHLKLYPEIAEATGDLISDKIADKIAKIFATE